jgi:hypothetical protein
LIVFELHLTVFNYNFDYTNCKHNNNLIACEKFNRQVETYTAYVVEDSLKIVSKSGRNMSVN